MRGGNADIGKQGIVEAGDEERNPHWLLLPMNLHNGHRAQTLCRLIPGSKLSAARRENLRGRMLRDGTHLPQAVQVAHANQLHQRIAMRRRLVRPGDYWYIERISQPLVKPCVSRSAA